MPFPLTVAEFRARFPAFAGDPPTDALVQAKLAEAEAEIDETVWGAQAATGQGYCAAHKLALEPFGRGARLSEKDTKTIYGEQYTALAQTVGGSYRVVLP